MEDVTLMTPPIGGAETYTRTGGGHTTAWKGGEFSFRDLLDTINPLQHIPVVNTIYRAITGDTEIGNIPRLVGDTLFGGPIGLLASVVGLAVKEETGRDIGEHAVALLHDSPPAGGTAVASAEPTPAPAETAAAPAPAEPTAAAKNAAEPPAKAEPEAVPVAAAAAPARPAPAFGRPGMAMPARPAVAAAATDPAERDFMAQNAALQRRLGGASGTAPRPTAPIPLQSTVFPTASRFHPAPAAVAAASIAPAQRAAPVTQTPTLAALPQNPPVEISQAMMAALDKYAAMQRTRNAGAAVDLVQ